MLTKGWVGLKQAVPAKVYKLVFHHRAALYTARCIRRLDEGGISPYRLKVPKEFNLREGRSTGNAIMEAVDAVHRGGAPSVFESKGTGKDSARSSKYGDW